MIPSNSLEGLTAEDFRLLLNGVGAINVQTLIGYTSFNDESGKLTYGEIGAELFKTNDVVSLRIIKTLIIMPLPIRRIAEGH